MKLAIFAGFRRLPNVIASFRYLILKRVFYRIKSLSPSKRNIYGFSFFENYIGVLRVIRYRWSPRRLNLE